MASPSCRSPVALDADPLEPEVADDGIHGLELDARAEKRVGGGKVRGGFPAGGLVVGEVLPLEARVVAGRRVARDRRRQARAA